MPVPVSPTIRTEIGESATCLTRSRSSRKGFDWPMICDSVLSWRARNLSRSARASRWSARILDETQKTISEITKGATDGSKQRAAIEAAFPESLVTGYEVFEGKLELPDPDARWVGLRSWEPVRLLEVVIEGEEE